MGKVQLTDLGVNQTSSLEERAGLGHSITPEPSGLNLQQLWCLERPWSSLIFLAEVMGRSKAVFKRQQIQVPRFKEHKQWLQFEILREEVEQYALCLRP